MFCLLVGLQQIHAAEFETWRSANGHSFEGKLLGSANGQVRLQGRDGKIITAPLTALDEASKAKVAGSAGATAGGLDKGSALYHAQGKNYEYFQGNSPGREYLQIRFLEGGKPIPHYGSPRIRFNLKKNIFEEGKNRQRALKLTDIRIEKEKKKSADMRLIYENGAEVLAKTRSLSDGVGLTFDIDKQADTSDSLALEVRTVYPALLEFDPKDKLYKGVLSAEGVPFPQLSTLLAGYKATGTRKGQDTSFGFHESPEGLKGQLLRLETPAQQDLLYGLEGQGAVSTFFYGGKKMIEGFSVKFENPKKEGSVMPEFFIRAK